MRNSYVLEIHQISRVSKLNEGAMSSNKKIIATETQKNTVYQLAKVLPALPSPYA